MFEVEIIFEFEVDNWVELKFKITIDQMKLVIDHITDFRKVDSYSQLVVVATTDQFKMIR